MATLRKVPVVWATGAGGPGLSVFYSDTADDITVLLGTFFNAIKASFPPVVAWTIPAAGDTIDSTTSQPNGVWSGGTAASIAGTGGATYMAGTGGMVRWLTGSILNGRKVYGRTFLLPLFNGAGDSDGSLGAGTLATLQGAATTIAATAKLRVVHRPTSVAAADGSAFVVSAAVVPDKIVSLRGRRF